MTTPDLERAARAVAETMVYSGYDAETRAVMMLNNMGTATAYARAAITAILEPSEGMIAAVGEAVYYTTNPKLLAENILRAMCRHILGDEA
jgi:hypothetical protein